MFNALMYIKDLERVGVPREQAEAQVQLVMSCFEENVATKSDMGELRAEFRSEFSGQRGEFAGLKGEFADLKGEFSVFRNDISELKNDVSDLKSKFSVLSNDVLELKNDVSQLRFQMTAMKSDLIIKLGGLMVICATLGTGILGLLIKS